MNFPKFLSRENSDCSHIYYAHEFQLQLALRDRELSILLFHFTATEKSMLKTVYESIHESNLNLIDDVNKFERLMN